MLLYMKGVVDMAEIPNTLMNLDPEPKRETIEAMIEGEKILRLGESRFANADEMFDDLGI